MPKVLKSQSIIRLVRCSHTVGRADRLPMPRLSSAYMLAISKPPPIFTPGLRGPPASQRLQYFTHFCTSRPFTPDSKRGSSGLGRVSERALKLNGKSYLRFAFLFAAAHIRWPGRRAQPVFPAFACGPQRTLSACSGLRARGESSFDFGGVYYTLPRKSWMPAHL